VRKVLLAIVATLFIVPVFAESPTAQGNFVVTLPLFDYQYGFGNMYHISGEGQQYNWTLGAEQFDLGVQWFVIDNLAIGGSAAVARSGVSSGSNVGDCTTYSIMPELSYYYPIGKFLPFASVSLNYQYVSYPESAKGYPFYNSNTTYISVPMNIGISYMIGKNLAPYISVEYRLFEQCSAKNCPTANGHLFIFDVGVKAFF